MSCGNGGGENIMINRRIILSTISVVGSLAIAAGATYAYFTSTQVVQANTVSSGTLNFQAVIKDTAGNDVNFSDSNIAPGQTYTRCLWVSNAGSVAGRFKVYVSAESGDATLGNGLTINNVVMNPTTGACSQITNPFSTASQYGPSNYTIPSLNDVAVRGPLMSASTTPFKIASSSDAMQGGYYALYAVTVSLDPSVTVQGTSYTTDLTVLGMQNEGSLTNW